MNLAIMQPYFLPYIGYLQLLDSVDKLILYDNLKYTKKGWINRNRYLVNGDWKYFTVSLEKDSDFKVISERNVTLEFISKGRQDILRKLKGAYGRAPYFSEVEPILTEVFSYESANLFDYVLNSIKLLIDWLEIEVEIIASSTVEIPPELTGSDMVLSYCQAMKATSYHNPIGGVSLYSQSDFRRQNIDLKFIQTRNFSYRQFDSDFVTNLSIIDVMMFNEKDEVKNLLEQYDLVDNDFNKIL